MVVVVSNEDPVRARRARIAGRVRWGMRAGYLALAVAIVAFLAAVPLDFPTIVVNVSVGGLVAACVFLPLAIIVSYGIRAAEREERDDRRR
jgi:hypothetical protein